MKRIPVEVTAITVCPPYQGYMLILREMEGIRWLPIFIGQPEALSITTIQKAVRAQRPLTFDLVQTLLEAVGARVEEVVVTELRDSTFFAEVILRLSSGGVRQVDSRPSDAIALALRTRAPIFISEKVMIEAGQSAELAIEQNDLGDQLKELNQQLTESVEQEAYEKAARLRDQIRKIESRLSPEKA